MTDEYTDMITPVEKVKSDDDTVQCHFKIKRKLLREYDALCATKNVFRAKRLRGFMIFELKKAEDIKAEEKRKAEELEKANLLKRLSDAENALAAKELSNETADEIFDPFADHSNESDGFSKPKGLNTSVSEN